MAVQTSTRHLRAMTRFAQQTHADLLQEARRPDLVRVYNEPEHLARLWQSYHEARRWEWPSVMLWNV